MHVVILHHEVVANATEDDRDVLVQADCVSEALVQRGHRVTRMSCSLNLERVSAELERLRADVVFNLVETLGNTDRLAPLAPLLLDAIQQRYTGAPAEALWLTTGKLATKQRLRSAGLPTADWLSDDHALAQPIGAKFILKCVFEHASFGLDDSAVVQVATESELSDRLRQLTQRLNRPCFAEEYIDGREFNLSLLGNAGDVEVLPPAEIQFEGFAAGRPRIVGYRAKWAADSQEYVGTPRTFTFSDADADLLEKLRQLARGCWKVFGLRGYARVDFRVDASGQPWILEINANPCLSPDAGYAAALQRAGIPFVEAVERIVKDVGR